MKNTNSQNLQALNQSEIRDVIQAQGEIVVIYANGTEEAFVDSAFRLDYFRNILDSERFRRWQGHGYIEETCRIVDRVRSMEMREYSEPQDLVDEVLRLLDVRKPLLVLGELGIGKSTLLKRLAYIYAKKAIDEGRDVPLPVYLPLIRFVDDIWECFQGALNETWGTNLTRDTTELLLTQTDCLVMFDGLGELQPFHDSGIRAVRNFVATCPQNQYVFTCRKSEYQRELGDTVQGIIQIQRLKDRSRLDYLREREELDGDGAERLYNQIVTDPGLEKLANNPLFLEMMVEMSTRGEMPSTQGQLFQVFVMDLLEREQRRSQVRREVKERALTRLGFDMQEERQERREERDMMQFLHAFLEEWHEDVNWRELLEALRANDLLREDSGMWFFRHATFQRFFAALKLNRSDQSVVQERSQDEWWHPVILFLAGLVDDPNTLISAITETDPLFAYQTFTACDRTKVTSETTREIAQRLTEGYYSSDSGFSSEVHDALVGIGRPAVEPIVNACADYMDYEEDPLLDQVVEMLLEMEEPVVEDLVPLLGSRSSGVRLTAVYLLGELGDLEIVPALIDMLEDRSVDVVAEAIQVLGELGDERIEQPLQQFVDLPEVEQDWEGQKLSRLAQEALDRI